VNAQLTLPSPAAARTERQKLFRLLKLFAYRARYLQLFHSCPHPGLGDAPRNKWNRKINWAERRVAELGRELAK
jgi:hypothetical protein